MTDVHVFFDNWGLPLAFFVAFAEFVGFPVAGVPLMIAVGSLASTQGFSFIAVTLTAAAGVWLGDLLWFRAAHRDAPRVINVACGLASNPRVCVTHVQRKLTAAGPGFLVVAKLIPGVSNLAASAAGLSEMSRSVFLPVNAVAALLWATMLVGAGWVFSGWVDRGLGWLAAYGRIGIVVMAALIVMATVWRVYKVRLHTGLHVREGKGR